MLRLDYLSCVLTIASTVMIGRRKWQGWVVAAANSVIICVIGLRTAQTGFIPANVFCLALYGYNIFQWCGGKRTTDREQAGAAEAKKEVIAAHLAVAVPTMPTAELSRGESQGMFRRRSVAVKRRRTSHRLRPRSLQAR